MYVFPGEFKRNHAVLKEVVAKKQKEILHDESTKYSICLHTNNQTDLYLENGMHQMSDFLNIDRTKIIKRFLTTFLVTKS